MLRLFRLDEARNLGSTHEKVKFVFDLPNTLTPLSLTRLDYWCHCYIYREEAMEMQRDAFKRAGLPAPPTKTISTSFFYGRERALFVVNWDTALGAMVAWAEGIKVDSSRGKIHHRRPGTSRSKASKALVGSATQVISLGVIYAGFYPSECLLSLPASSNGEGGERWFLPMARPSLARAESALVAQYIVQSYTASRAAMAAANRAARLLLADGERCELIWIDWNFIARAKRVGGPTKKRSAWNTWQMLNA
ncbi:hypothetical protein C8R44DRAFT_755470 [Mycena epipterygia]|nr:hypothetical protein C8R44DRAFT_755470 [Mycena epipterygia]